MIIPDVNLLLYAYDDNSSHHPAALDWWEGLMDGDEDVGLPWIVINGFIRLMANPGVVSLAILPSAASDIVEDWLRHPHVAPINPGDNHLAYFRRYLAVPGAGPNLVTDAHIAALAAEHDAEVHTNNDSDFARFSGLRWRNPLR